MGTVEVLGPRREHAAVKFDNYVKGAPCFDHMFPSSSFPMSYRVPTTCASGLGSVRNADRTRNMSAAINVVNDFTVGC
jgi:hypothetical protein